MGLQHPDPQFKSGWRLHCHDEMLKGQEVGFGTYVLFFDFRRGKAVLKEAATGSLKIEQYRNITLLILSTRFGG